MDDGQEEEEPVREEEEGYIPVASSPRVSVNNALNSGRESVGAGRSKRSRVVERGGGGGGGEILLIGDENGECSQGKWNRTEIDDLICPICTRPWTNEGDHQICCLPCGHLYGFKCISKWLTQNEVSAKCPQCKMDCSLEDVRKLVAPRIVVDNELDNESQKMIQSLKDECASLQAKRDIFMNILSVFNETFGVPPAENVEVPPAENVRDDDPEIQPRLRVQKKYDELLVKFDSMLNEQEQASRNQN